MAEAEVLVPSKFSLLQYDNAIAVTTRPEKKTKETAKKPSATKCKVKSTLPLIDVKQETIEVLNEILPPKEWEENGKKWIQKVASNPATRLDVINLQEKLDIHLKQQQARETGICLVRRELYSQCFNEIIRQVTINCAERGILLTRVRDEIEMTMIAYRTLYQSSIAFGIRKALQAEQGREDLIAKVDELESCKEDLEKKLSELQLNYDRSKMVMTEAREATEKKHAEEIEFLKKVNQQLKKQLEGLIAPKK